MSRSFFNIYFDQIDAMPHAVILSDPKPPMPVRFGALHVITKVLYWSSSTAAELIASMRHKGGLERTFGTLGTRLDYVTCTGTASSESLTDIRTNIKIYLYIPWRVYKVIEVQVLCLVSVNLRAGLWLEDILHRTSMLVIEGSTEGGMHLAPALLSPPHPSTVNRRINISPGLIFVRKHFLVGLYMGAYIRTRFCVSNISHLLTLFLYNTRLIYKHKFIYGWAYIRNGESVSKLVGLYMGGGGAYIRGLIFEGLRYFPIRVGSQFACV